ncbi:MAG TPA: hypothetical protein VFT50_02705 [Baekduia sp.]|nr:hypothetical protein [Baekduia sp.]
MTTANAINLTSADLQGFTDKGAIQIKDAGSSERQQARCLGVLPLLHKRVAYVLSHSYQQSGDSYLRAAHSEVSVFPNAKLAGGYLNALGSKRTPACSVPAIRKAFGPTLRNLRVRMHHIPAEVAGGVGWRTTLLWKSGEPRREFIDVFAFARGRAVVALTTTSFPSLFPQEVDGHLVQLLAARASAQGTVSQRTG